VAERLTGEGNGDIMILKSANSIQQVPFFKGPETTVYISGCSKSPLVDLTQKDLLLSWRSQRFLRGQSTSGLFLFAESGRN